MRNFSSTSLRVFFYFSIVHQGVYGFARWRLQQEDVAKVFAGTEYRNGPQLTALRETAKRGEFDFVIIVDFNFGRHRLLIHGPALRTAPG
jgi:hypothetical protein